MPTYRVFDLEPYYPGLGPTIKAGNHEEALRKDLGMKDEHDERIKPVALTEEDYSNCCNPKDWKHVDYYVIDLATGLTKRYVVADKDDLPS